MFIVYERKIKCTRRRRGGTYNLGAARNQLKCDMFSDTKTMKMNTNALLAHYSWAGERDAIVKTTLRYPRGFVVAIFEHNWPQTRVG